MPQFTKPRLVRTAVDAIETAIAADHAGQYRTAVKNYAEGLTFLLEAAEAETHSGNRMQLKNKAIEHLERHKELTRVLETEDAKAPPLPPKRASSHARKKAGGGEEGEREGTMASIARVASGDLSGVMKMLGLGGGGESGEKQTGKSSSSSSSSTSSSSSSSSSSSRRATARAGGNGAVSERTDTRGKRSNALRGRTTSTNKRSGINHASTSPASSASSKAKGFSGLPRSTRRRRRKVPSASELNDFEKRLVQVGSSSAFNLFLSLSLSLFLSLSRSLLCTPSLL